MSETADKTRTVHAVLVTFRPETAKLKEILAALEGTVGAVILVDNGSLGWDPKSLGAGRQALTIEQLPSNAGIGAAQNRGIALARARNASHILFLDQDSLPQAGMVSALLNALAWLEEEGRLVACVGPRTRVPEGTELSNFTTLGWLGPKRAQCGDANHSVVECDSLLSSGSLIPLRAIDAVGGMDEALFIDLVDTEWCYRAKAKGYGVFGACGAVLEHRLGEDVRRLWAGRWRRVPRHAPFRYYYIFRNTVLLSRMKHVPLRWVLYYLKWLTILFLVHGLFARRRSGEIAMMLKGAVHGLRGVSGRMDGG